MAALRMVLAVGGAAVASAAIAVVVMSGRGPAPALPAPGQAAAPVATPAAPVTASSPPAAPAATPQAAMSEASGVQPDSSAMRFQNFVQQFSLVRDSAAYVGASFDAPQLYPLRAGTGMVSASRSPDGAWIVAMTADGQAAFLPASDLGLYNPHTEPQLNLPGTVSGTATVLDTGTLNVAGTTIALGGVIGETGEFAEKMQNMIDSQGGKVNCTLQRDAYTCQLGSGSDLARTALFNGGADVAPDASADYHQQAAAAQAAHRGRWQSPAP